MDSRSNPHTPWGRAAANEITVRGLDDIIDVAEVATVVWDQGGDLSNDELMMRTLASLQVLLKEGWAEIGDMVVSEWMRENQKLSLTDPEEAMERLFARSRELMNVEPESGWKPISKWPLSPDEALTQIKEQWTAQGTRTPFIVGWLLTTAAGDERGGLILYLQRQVIDFALKNGSGSVVRVEELADFLHTIAPDFSPEELREGVISALDGLFRRRLVEPGTMRRTLRWFRFVRWRFLHVEEALARARRTCVGLSGARRGDSCVVRVL